mmetsp:Transcript_82017/g.183207  ORF Transcript_82017/g.183207 Transcript_82017/m.183207 type:complete len:226 (+) Transcript_82017:380-1057(+)
MSKSGSRSSPCASRSSSRSRRVAATASRRLNSSSPTCSRRRSVICSLASSLPRHRCNATRESASTSSSCAELRRRASTASTLPTWTQSQSGHRKVLSRSINGWRMSSICCRVLVPETLLSSSITSGVTLTPCKLSASTPGTQRCWTADTKGVSPSSRFTSALAFTSAATAFSMHSFDACVFVTNSCKAVKPKLLTPSSSSSCVLASAPCSRVSSRMPKQTSRSSS